MMHYVPNRSVDLTQLGVERVLGPDGRADPSQDPRLDKDLVVRIYETMQRARLVDERMLGLQRQGRVGFHVGFRGEEAAVIASAAALREQDWIFPCYRELGALLWRGFSLQTYLDNMYGNADDVVHGRQMPDHYTSKRLCYASVSSPIGTQITHAVGYAWAAKLRREDLISASFFGEGGTSSSDFHAGMNFAGVYKVPTLFLCRNNRWAISTPPDKQTASESFAAKGAAYGVRGVRCDGNDALAVYRTVREAVQRAARGEGPTLIELLTYRMGPHSSSDDPKVYRSDEETESYRKQDPILRLRRHLEVIGAWGERDERALVERVEGELKQAIDTAEKKPGPAIETLFDDVYAERPWHLSEQCESTVNGPRPKKGH
ncbi:MAG TPA: thiamine pyrophosphate-dependent enzyme [Polyangiaceae bacterium]|nr:thiamine pyrophosphate-dependent enzyme [Polyangiaceae bacterium]